MRPARTAILAIGLLATLALAGVGRPDGATSAPAGAKGEITVNGSARVETAADRASFSFGVVTPGRTASQALAANATEARKVIGALIAAGIDRKDVQTQQVSLNPRFADDGATIVGYTAQNTVSATLRDADRAGAVVDAAVAAGANQVFGPALVASDRDELYRGALKQAYADAHAKAQALAAASGQLLGGALTIVEGFAAAPLPAVGRAGAAADATPIEPGTQQIDATVTVTFALA